MICKPLSLPEQAANGGFTHMIVITANDLTETTTSTAQSITLITLVTGDIMARCEDNVVVSFQDASDSAFNADTRTLGDNSAVNTHTAAAEMNANGTVVVKKFSNTAVGPYTAGNTFKLTVNAMSGKALNDLDIGELHIFVQIIRASQLSGATPATPITK